MPRYLVQRTFPSGLAIPINDDGVAAIERVISCNAEDGVTWVHSYVSANKSTSYCIYDGPSPDAIRAVGERNALPVDSVTQVSVLDPYLYR